MNMQELEKDYDETMKDLKNMSIVELVNLVHEKRDVLDNMEHVLAIQKANGNLPKAIDINKKLGEHWLEDFQDPFWDELRLKKAQNGFSAEINCFQQDLEDANEIYEVENLLDNFYDNFNLVHNQWMNKCLWDCLTDKDIFDKQALIEFISILDEYKERLISDEI